MMVENGIIDPSQHVIQVPGSGVDIGYFAEKPMPEGPPVFVMISRLMRDKGVADYVEAARLVKTEIPDARFTLVGRYEPENPTGYSKEEVDRWVREGLVEHIPETRDVRPYLAAAHAFVLPSYYREGLPRTILEALSSGRPVLTTDMPGCREPIDQGENGWLVPPKSPDELAAAMLRTVADRRELERMGAAARQTATQRYSVEIVNAQLISEMRLDLPEATGTSAVAVG
jgi:glycosyltransferase involved in cell wall biosynthesis